MIITSADELLKIEKRGSYMLGCDIDFKGQSINKLVYDFSGTLDGNGYKILNFVLTDFICNDSQPLALFHSLSRATIKDLAIESFEVRFDDSVYKPEVAIICTKATNSTFKSISVKGMRASSVKVPFVYDACDCTFEQVKLLEDNIILAKYLF